ncbi:MAG: sulfatase-like hydrolase/transferase, partial [Clostridia bacterium]|nr:sulfatase-like hydrolase/transferase [Clostridia bacterium]
MESFFKGLFNFVNHNKDLASLFTKPAVRAGESELHYEVRVKEKNQRNRFFFLFVPLAIFCLEVIFHIFVFGEFSVTAFVLIGLFSFSLGFLISGILLLTPLGINRLLTPICIFAITLIIASQYVYYSIFGGLYSLELMDMAGEAATDFISVLIDKMSKSWLGILLLFLPLAFYLKKRKKYAPSFAPSFKFRFAIIIAAILLQLLAIGIVGLDRGNIYNGTGNCYYYSYDFEPLESAKRFGVMTNMRLDLKQFLFGTKEVPFVIEEVPAEETTTDTAPEEIVEEPIVYGDNVMDINFDALIESEKDKTVREMHEYFKSLTPTKQNEYTGLFEGKNLIFITLEGFSYKTIDPLRTPTLYKMANEGFVFTNSYTSLWGGSTATGEYAATTGNFHQSAKCLGMCGGKNMYFALGNQFSRIGYETYAFHNHTYDYYSRDKSH